MDHAANQSVTSMLIKPAICRVSKSRHGPPWIDSINSHTLAPALSRAIEPYSVHTNHHRQGTNFP